MYLYQLKAEIGLTCAVISLAPSPEKHSAKSEPICSMLVACMCIKERRWYRNAYTTHSYTYVPHIHTITHAPSISKYQEQEDQIRNMILRQKDCHINTEFCAVMHKKNSCTRIRTKTLQEHNKDYAMLIPYLHNVYVIDHRERQTSRMSTQIQSPFMFALHFF
jgi:hypothetical protein